METTIEAVSPVRWTSADLESLPENNGVRYEIIGGELFMANQPHWYHQNTCNLIGTHLTIWSLSTGSGSVVQVPGVIFDDENDVIPDVVWVSSERLEVLLDEAGHLRGAPELVVEALSPGVKNERRDRKFKLELYSLRGVQEYWLANWRLKTIEVYRREGGRLQLVGIWQGKDELTSPLLPGFRVEVSRFFA